MKKQRKQYAPEEKVVILRRHLLEKEPISKLCDEVGLQPTVFYRWQKEFFENGAAAFERGYKTFCVSSVLQENRRTHVRTDETGICIR